MRETLIWAGTLVALLTGCAGTTDDQRSSGTVYVPRWAHAFGTPASPQRIGVFSDSNGDVRDGLGIYNPAPGMISPPQSYQCIWAQELGTDGRWNQACPGVSRYAGGAGRTRATD